MPVDEGLRAPQPRRCPRRRRSRPSPPRLSAARARPRRRAPPRPAAPGASRCVRHANGAVSSRLGRGDGVKLPHPGLSCPALSVSRAVSSRFGRGDGRKLPYQSEGLCRRGA
ncbi:hypothetical protein C5E05_12295 [Pseudoclavibacter sp. AY1H1]|nr:hypothetical protein C5E05_12295 [Pseudoclavibacter sp. AY1H1]